MHESFDSEDEYGDIDGNDVFGIPPDEGEGGYRVDDAVLPVPAELLSRCGEFRSRVERVLGQREQMQKERERQAEAVGEAKARLAMQETMDELFEELNYRAHNRALGKFEAMLTGLVQEVLQTEHQVHIKINTQRQSIGIEFMVGRPGRWESALSGRGGSVANILSAGLRYIALVRSKQTLMPFMVLDESDCWIKPDHVLAFSQAIQGLSQIEGYPIQTLMISHHDVASLGESAFLVGVYRGNEDTAMVDAGRVPAWNPDSRGVREIRLTNFMSHARSVIPLAPGVTAIHGDNDIGKSVIVEALKAAFYGQSNESMIRHEMPEARVEVDLGPDGRFIWTRNRKKSKHTCYRLEDRATGEMLHETEGSALPEWVRNLGVRTIGEGRDELNVQLLGQKTPVFLLDQPASRQAQVLSVGREAAYLASMQTIYRQQLTKDRATVKSVEPRIKQMDQVLKTSASAIDLAGELRSVESRIQTIVESRQKEQQMVQLRDEIGRREPKVRALKEAVQRLVSPQEPSLLDLTELTRAFHDISRLEPLLNRAKTLFAALERPIPEPEFKPFDHLTQCGKEIFEAENRLGRLKSLLPLPQEPVAPALKGYGELQQLADQIAKHEQALQQGQREQVELETQMRTSDAALKALIEQMGGECPVCHSGVTVDTVLAHMGHVAHQEKMPGGQP